MRRRSILAAALGAALVFPGVSFAQMSGQYSAGSAGSSYSGGSRSVQGAAGQGGGSSYTRNRAFGAYGLSQQRREKANGYPLGRAHR
jgi:hypothetical protein